jgi:hypothetical protein
VRPSKASMYSPIGEVGETCADDLIILMAFSLTRGAKLSVDIVGDFNESTTDETGLSFVVWSFGSLTVVSEREIGWLEGDEDNLVAGPRLGESIAFAFESKSSNLNDCSLSVVADGGLGLGALDFVSERFGL